MSIVVRAYCTRFVFSSSVFLFGTPDPGSSGLVLKTDFHEADFIFHEYSASW